MLQILADNLRSGLTLLDAIINTIGSPILLSILGAHLLFNMKEAGEKGLNEGTCCRSKSTVSGIVFAEPPQAATVYSQDEAGQNEAIEVEEIC